MAGNFLMCTKRISLKERSFESQLGSGEDGKSQTISLFQEGAVEDRHLDLCVWFDNIKICTAQGQEIQLDDFIAGGKRWWDGLYADDPRTRDKGINPLSDDFRFNK
jgi:hypothetical protein